jgi:hypothetical protein
VFSPSKFNIFEAIPIFFFHILVLRQKGRKTKRQKDRKTQTHKYRKTQRHKDTKTERQKDRETEKHKDIESWRRQKIVFDGAKIFETNHFIFLNKSFLAKMHNFNYLSYMLVLYVFSNLYYS